MSRKPDPYEPWLIAVLVIMTLAMIVLTVWNLF